MIWLAVHTYPQKEAFANMHLRRAGFETFFPHYEPTWEPREGSKTFTELHRRAYLPRYLFARAAAWCAGQINILPGVRTVLCRAGGDPCPIPEVVMNELFKAAEKSGRVHRYIDNKPAFAGVAGMSVKPKEGHPLFGFELQIARVVDDKKILAILHRQLFGAADRVVEVGIADVDLVVCDPESRRVMR